MDGAVARSALMLVAAMTLTQASGVWAQAPMVDLSPAAVQAAGITAIVGGKVLTVSHGTIEGGTVVLEGGRIAAVGPAAQVKVPQGAKVIDAKGMTVYPGLIDAETNLGLSEVESDQVNNDLVELSDEIFPNMHVADAFHAETERIPVTRFNGVTNAIVAPESSDTMPGQDILIQLAGRDRDSMILNRDIALAMNFGQEPKRGGRGQGGGGGIGRQFPSTRMGEISQLRQALIDAQEYLRKKSEPAKPEGKGGDAKGSGDGKADGGKAGGSSKTDLKSEALLPYLKGERPVVLGVYQGYDVETAMALAEEFHLKVVLNHVTHAGEILDRIAAYKVPVIFGPIYDFPGPNERFDAVYTMPAELAKRGVKVAMASYGVQFNRNLPYAAGFAVAYGMPYDEALRAITLTPAEIFGVADRLGSLDVGKAANVVMANGDPLDVRTDVKQVWISGVAVPMETRQTRLRDEYTHK